jgi:hypothetical protein
MDTSSGTKRLRMTFKGEAFPSGAVPISLLADKLQALQRVLFHIAATVSNDASARRGLWFNRYRELAELTYATSHHSELAIEVDLGSPRVLLAPEFDNRESLVDMLFRFGSCVQRGCRDFDALRLDRDQRGYLLRAFEELLPDTEADYQIELANNAPARHPPLIFTPNSRRKLREFRIQETAPRISEEVSLVGELIKIHVDVGPPKITVRHSGREIDCFYPDTMRDQIANLMGGSMVEVTGEATLDSRGIVEKLDRLLDVVTVSMDPLRIARFEHAGEVFPLRTPLVVNVEYEDDLWVYHCPEINLWGCGEQREKALGDLHENYAYLWHEIAEEADSQLDQKAQQIKTVLREITNKQPAGA